MIPNPEAHESILKLSAFFLCVLLLASCGDSGGDAPTPDAATFRVDIEQSGAYEKFIQIMTISGGDFYRAGTQEPMPTVLFDEHLTEERYSYEAEGVRELEIGSTTGFSSVETPPSAMELKITVSRNGKQIDEKTYTYTHETDEANESLSYKANPYAAAPIALPGYYKASSKVRISCQANPETECP